MSKRKQRSTAIRKRIEKKQREEERAKKRATKAAGKGGDALLAFSLPRDRVEACRAALVDLEQRLAQGSMRGWTTADLQGEHGLAWLGRVLAEALGASDDPVRVEVLEQSKHPLLDRLSTLELAASGLKLAWDEAGFDQLVRALNQATEVGEDEPEEEEGAEAPAGEAAASGDETASGDEVAEDAP